MGLFHSCWEEWYDGNYEEAINIFFKDLNDDNASDYDGGLNEKFATLADSLEILMDKPKLVYPKIEDLLSKLEPTDEKRWVLLTGIREDLWIKPNHFIYAFGRIVFAFKPVIIAGIIS